MSDALDRFAAFIDRLAPEEPQPERGTQAATPGPAPELMVGDDGGVHQNPPSSVAPTSTEVARQPRSPVTALKMHRDVNWKIDKREVAERLSRFLDATSKPRQRSAGAERLAAGPIAPEVERDAKPPSPTEAQAGSAVMPGDAGAPTAPKHPVQRLAASCEPPPELSNADDSGAQARRVARLQVAVHRRPPSWSDPAALPSVGCSCNCCRGQRWWCEREAPKGWRCWTCHPPDHLPSSAIHEVLTESWDEAASETASLGDPDE